jgi:L-ascorbate metabolism protein UlaG (beta-lactamase superfamily)
MARGGDATYPVLPHPDREALEAALPPWDGIDLVLVSHVHLDHFHPVSVGRHLQAAAGARLVSSEEGVGAIERAVADWPAIAGRVRAIPWAVGSARTVEVAGARVTLLGLSHGGGRFATVQNLGHLIEGGGVTVCHAGDAVPTEENFASRGLASRGSDLAFLPWWHLASDEAAAVVRRHLAPRRIVLIHASAADEAAALAAIRDHDPSAQLLRRMLQDRIAL